MLSKSKKRKKEKQITDTDVIHVTKCNFFPKESFLANFIIDYLLGKNYHKGKIMCMPGYVLTKMSQL